MKKITLLSSSALFAALFITNAAFADTTTVRCATSPCEAETNFQVNVTEVLAVSLTPVATNASGEINTFLRNTYNLGVTSNNGAGFTASMTTKTTDTALSNTATISDDTIPTLTASYAKSAFPANYWGYSLAGKNNGDTLAGTDSGVYNPLVALGAATPITLLSETSATTASQDIFFGAKADATIDSGTYSNTVVISVVSGVTGNDNPVIPVNPAKPSDASETNPVYDSTNNRTVYVATTENADGTTTTTTTVTPGDTTSTYTSPLGVTTTSVGGGSPLATGLAVTAAVAAATGFIFFIIAKRRREDEDDEDDY